MTESNSESTARSQRASTVPVAGPGTRGAREQLEDLAREDRLVAWLHARFRRRLNVEDAEDVCAEAFAQATRRLSCGGLPQARGEIELWLKKAAYHRAIDLLRARDGQGQLRPTLVPLHHVPEDELPVDQSSGTDATSGTVLRDAERAEQVRAVRTALAQLPPLERRVLVLRHFAALPVRVSARRIALSPAKFERIHTAAMRHLAVLLASQMPTAECLLTRRAIAHATSDPDARGLGPRWSAHIEVCLHCRTEAVLLAQLRGVAA